MIAGSFVNSIDIQQQLLGYAPFVLVFVLLVGGCYETFNCRCYFFREDKKIIKAFTIEKFRSILNENNVINKAFDDKKTLDAFWSIVNNDVTLSKKSEKIMANGLYLSCFQDTILISIMAEVIFIPLLFFKGNAYIIYVVGIIALITISMSALAKSTTNHKKLVLAQIQYIELCLKAKPVQSLDEFFPSLLNGVGKSK